MDSETGLYYLRARYYDTFTGRFISEDISILYGGNNYYHYRNGTYIQQYIIKKVIIMGDKINTGVELLIVFSILALMQFFRYKFPHFCMHFFDGLSKFGVNSFDNLERCYKHSKEDIDRFKRRQKCIFYFVCILFAIILFYYAISQFGNW